MREDHLFPPYHLLGVRHGDDFMLRTNQKLTGMQVQELLFIRADCRHIVLRLKDPGEAGEIVEPEFSRTINVVVRQARKLVPGRVTLHIPPYELFHFRQRTEERRVIVPVMGDEVVVAGACFSA